MFTEYEYRKQIFVKRQPNTTGNVGTLKCWLQSKDWFNLVYNINYTTNIWYKKL